MNSTITAALESFLGFLALVALIVAVWCIISLIVAHSGWRKLAASYPASRYPTGELFWARHFVGCRNMVRVIVTPDGLHISHLFPLLNCPPMFVPWSAVKDCGLWKAFLRTHLEIGITTGTDLFILVLPAKARSAVEKYVAVTA